MLAKSFEDRQQCQQCCNQCFIKVHDASTEVIPRHCTIKLSQTQVARGLGPVGDAWVRTAGNGAHFGHCLVFQRCGAGARGRFQDKAPGFFWRGLFQACEG